MKNTAYTLLLTASLFSITSCTVEDIYGPNAFPRGYAPLDREYKTVIPDRPYFIGESYSDEEVILSHELWTMGVNNMLNELEMNSFMNGLSVYVMPVAPDNSFDVRMDYYFRKALMERGYLVVTDPILNIPSLRATARLPGYQDGLQRKGRAIDNIDDIQNEFDVMEDPQNNGQPYVFMGIEVVDLDAPPKEQVLLSVETLQTVLEKDIREIRGSLIDPPIVYGVKKTSNINP